MAKIKVRKDVMEQMVSKLKTPKNENIKPEFAEKLQKSALNSQNEQITGKLQANENLFAKNEFILKSNIFPIGHITEHPDGSLSQKVAVGKWIYLPYNIKDLADKQTGNDEEDKKRAREILERMNLAMQAPIITKINPIQVPNGNEKFLENYLKPYLDKIDNEIQSGNLRCRANGKTVVQFLRTHCYKNKYGVRKGDDLQNHAGYLPFVIPLIKKYGITDKAMNRSDGKGSVFIELVGRADYINPLTNKNERVGISVVLVTLGKRTTVLRDISVFKIFDKYNLIKSFQHNSMDVSIVPRGVDRNALSSFHALSNIAHCNNLSSKNVTKSLTYSGHKLQGRTKLYGMDISIENKKGSYRSGTDKDGHKWKTLMHYDYGYIRGTVGVDNDHEDCYIGPDKNAEKVYIIHQNDPVTHKYDEDKCMLCFSSAADAKAAYMKQYDRPGFYGSMTTMTIEQFKSFIFSHKGKMVHKSFDIQITDITENNKQKKLEQFNKALNAIANNQPFVIKHIPADSSKRYENLTVRLMDFDRSKIEKAVHKVALSLDADISGASKGETFVYKAQEELVDKYFKEFTNRTRAVYNFVIGYFDLPDIRIVSKASELRHKGKILYNPETGLPIKESEWKKFVVELEKFLNRNYTGIGEKIVLSAESLGIILDRLSKTNSLEAIRKMSVADLKAKRYDVDWISESVKTMKDKFGDVISRERQARIQIAMDSAAQRVTRVKDDMRNNIQQIIIDGIRDKQSKSVVAQNLFDKCASLNRDMQRIADSEVQMATSRAYIKEELYNTPENEKVYFKRFEMLDDNTCRKCRKINGKVVLWSDVALPDEHIKDEFADIAIWEGKTGGDYPESVLHPWCRGAWIRYYPEV